MIAIRTRLSILGIFSCLLLGSSTCRHLYANAKSSTSQEAVSPSTVVMSYYRALQKARNASQLNRFYSAQMLAKEEATMKELPKANQAKYLQFMKMGLINKIRTTNEIITGDKSRVFVEAIGDKLMDSLEALQCGTAKPIVQRYGAFFLVREDGQWKIDADLWNADPLPADAKNPDQPGGQ